MARKKQHRKRIGKKVYSIIVEGETEKWYFDMMKREEALPNITIKPDLPSKRTLQTQYEMVTEHAESYDKVLWILDFDTILKENKEVRTGEKSRLHEFREYLKKLKNYDNVKVLVNTPCLEFWFLLHFEDTGKYFPACKEVTKTLGKTMPGKYEKTRKYFIENNLYKKLKPYQATALENAGKLGDFDIENPKTAKAEIYKVFNFVKIQSS